jgi:hypothetical protein
MRHPLSAKVGTTSPTSGGRSIGILRSRTKATEFSFFSFFLILYPAFGGVINEAPNFKDRRCDSVLPGQAYHAPQGAVIDECGAIAE